jgi:hypothetical protein
MLCVPAYFKSELQKENYYCTYKLGLFIKHILECYNRSSHWYN